MLDKIHEYKIFLMQFYQKLLMIEKNRYNALILLLISAIAITTFFIFQSPALAEDGFKEYTIVIDPGHGGLGSNNRDDKWDAVHNRYLQYYADGTHHENYSEHELVYELAKKIKQYLDLLNSSSGRDDFSEILQHFSPDNKLKNIRFKTYLSRKEGLKEGNHTGFSQKVNTPYRLYDFPDPDDEKRTLPGRISYINSLKPYLVVSLHMNPAGPNQKGGMATVITPGYKTFDFIRKVSMKRKQRSRFRNSVWYNIWAVTEDGWDAYRSAFSDSWVYFHGYRTKKNGQPWTNSIQGFRGYRHNMVQWRYADPPGWEDTARQHLPGPYAIDQKKFKINGKFWDRELGQAEAWRREDGKLGYGGDNHFASDELLRYIQYGMRSYLPERRKEGAMGEILPPFASTYSLPTYINAICAYLEVGHINRERDLSLLLKDREVVAKSIAAGIYSLFTGLKLKERFEDYKPKGEAVNFKRYEQLPEGNYFKIVAD